MLYHNLFYFIIYIFFIIIFLLLELLYFYDILILYIVCVAYPLNVRSTMEIRRSHPGVISFQCFLFYNIFLRDIVNFL